MNPAPNTSEKKWSLTKKILIAGGVVLLLAGLLIYLNLNKIISSALNKSFETTLASEVYTLKFENLRLNPLQRSISVYNVSFEPRESSEYPYINSFITLHTESLFLENVDLELLLESNELSLDRISINKPTVELNINGSNPILFPFKPSETSEKSGKKRTLEAYFLKEFELVDASFHVVNSVKNRDFEIDNFSISLKELLLDQKEGVDLISLKNMDISLEKFSGNLSEGPLKHAKFLDFRLMFDSVNLEKNLDTLIFKFRDMQTGIDSLDVHTKDSTFHLRMMEFSLGYLDRSILLKGLSFEPNMSNAELQKKFKYQTAHFSGTISSVAMNGVDFDSLIYRDKIFIDEILLDSVAAAVYKDNTKPKDLNRFPEYLGQSIRKIENPIRIKSVKIANANLINEKKKPDGTIAKVNISNGTAEVKNITNMSPDGILELTATAYLAGKVQSVLNLKFNYAKPQFSFEGRLATFDLTHLNPIIKAYTPAEIRKGIADEVVFSGLATHNAASGTLKFLYHDLEVDLMLHEEAKWRNSIVSFGANSVLHSKNPISENAPARTVQFEAQRDMNKGFINIIIKSVLDGMKETMIMSKGNRKEFNQLKRETRRAAKKEAREEKEQN